MTEDDSLLLPEEEMFEHFRFVSDKKQGLLRVDRYITDHMEQTSRHRVQLAIEAGYVRVNDKVVKANYKVKPLDVITIVMAASRSCLKTSLST